MKKNSDLLINKLNDEEMMQNEIELEELLSGKGGIIFQVTTAGGTVPIENAMIVISRQLNNDIYYLKKVFTDENGKTGLILVDAPSADLSLTPGNGTPFYTYKADIEADGYKLITDKEIQVFEGIASIQPIIMQPIYYRGV
jgi:hypothetical protein